MVFCLLSNSRDLPCAISSVLWMEETFGGREKSDSSKRLRIVHEIFDAHVERVFTNAKPLSDGFATLLSLLISGIASID